jgi:hypothetical protein
MSEEALPGGEEASREAWAKLEAEAIHYYDAVRSLQPAGKSRSLRHILNNLCEGLDPRNPRFPSQEEKSQEEYNLIAAKVEGIKKYLRLLEEFPEFKEKEFADGQGYFPELFSSLYDPNDFIDAYEAQLRGEKKEG